MALESDLFGKFGRHVEAGKIIFQEGDEGDQMYIIQSGKVKISRHISGKEHRMGIALPSFQASSNSYFNANRREQRRISTDCCFSRHH